MLTFRRPALLATAALTALVTIPAAGLAADKSQRGADMVIINPGGGIQLDGSDGVQAVVNGAYGYKPDPTINNGVPNNGSDQQFFAKTGQWCCSTGSGPNLNIGGQLVGNANVAGRGSWGVAPGDTALDWDTVQIVATSGSAVTVPVGTTTPASTPTGDGSATIDHTVAYHGLTYVLRRQINYLYPNSSYTDSYTLTIPPGNTDVVKLYLGGDAAPGDNDNGAGMMTTTPRRSVYEINGSSGIALSYSDVPGVVAPFDHWFVGGAYNARPWYRAGDNLDDSVDTSDHDAGINVQWTFPTAPGTYTRETQSGVGFQNASIATGFAVPTIDLGLNETSALQIQIVNTKLAGVTGVGYTYTLPAGLKISGVPTSNCGGALAAADGGTSIALSDVDVASASNCTVSVPVTAAAAGTFTVAQQDFTTSGTLDKGYDLSTLTATGTPATDSGSGTTNGTTTGTTSTASTSTSPPSGGPRLGVRVPQSLATAGLPVSAGGTVALPLVCPSGVPGNCDASGVLSTKVLVARTANGRHRQHALTTKVLARFRGVEIASGRKRLYSVRLAPATYMALRRAGVRRVPTTLRVVNRTATGAPVGTRERVWLRILPLVVPVTG